MDVAAFRSMLPPKGRAGLVTGYKAIYIINTGKYQHIKYS